MSKEAFINGWQKNSNELDIIGTNPVMSKSLDVEGDKWEIWIYEVYNEVSVNAGFPRVDHYEFVAFKNEYLEEWGVGTMPLTITQESKPKPEKTIKPKDNLVSSGSGILILDSGIIVTNFHIVEDATKIEVIFPDNGLKKTANIRLKDSKNDIAVLQLNDFSYASIFKQLIPFTISDANAIKVGEEVFTLGFPLGDIMGSKSRLSNGRINSLYGLQDDPRLFQISNPLQPGNSGGPLFNNKGELIGLVVSSLNAKYFYENVGVIPQNVNFAIKSTYIQNLISMMPEGDEITKRKNLVKQTKMEEQIEQLNPFVVQIKVY
jgi:serine protease Do